MITAGSDVWEMEEANFLGQLSLFYKLNKLPKKVVPKIDRKRVSLYKLYSQVVGYGGSQIIKSSGLWLQVAKALGVGDEEAVKDLYKEYLEAYEKVTLWGESYTSTTKTDFSEDDQPKRSKKIPTVGKPGPLVEDIEYTDGGYSNRILLALESDLPNEIDWAINKLLSITFTSDKFNFALIPGLLDTLIEMIHQYIDKAKPTKKKSAAEHPLLSSSLVEAELFHSFQSPEQKERILMIANVLRNCSFVIDNIRILTCYNPFKELIVKVLSLPSSTHYLPLKLSMLDIVDNISFCYKLNTKNDPMIHALYKQVNNRDRGLLLASIRTLSRLAIYEPNDQALASTIDDDVIRYLYQLLLLPDEEILTVVLDYFYQFSVLSNAVSGRLANLAPSNPVKMFMKFLPYRMQPNVAFFPPKFIFKSKSPASPSALPSQIQSTVINLTNNLNDLQRLLTETVAIITKRAAKKEYNLATLEEPTRFAAWILLHVQADPECSVSLEELYDNYKEMVKETPFIDLKDFTKLIAMQFATGSVPTFLNLPPNEVVIPGCKLKPRRQLPSPESLETQPAPAFNNKLPKLPIYVLNYPSHITASYIEDELSHDAAGIPLTAALILRNFSRNPWLREHFVNHIEELVLAAAKYPRLSKYLTTVLNEIKLPEGF